MALINISTKKISDALENLVAEQKKTNVFTERLAAAAESIAQSLESLNAPSEDAQAQIDEATEKINQSSDILDESMSSQK